MSQSPDALAAVAETAVKVVAGPLLKHFDLPGIFARTTELGAVIGEAELGEAKTLPVHNGLRGLKLACDRLRATLFSEGESSYSEQQARIQQADCSQRALIALRNIAAALQRFEQHVTKHAAGYAPGERPASTGNLMAVLGDGAASLWNAMSPYEQRQVEHLLPHARRCWPIFRDAVAPTSSEGGESCGLAALN